jgi:hypothetical protein
MRDMLIISFFSLECLKDNYCFVLVFDPTINASVLFFGVFDDFFLWQYKFPAAFLKQHIYNEFVELLTHSFEFFILKHAYYIFILIDAHRKFFYY